MPPPIDKKGVAETRREAASWAAKMRGLEAERSRPAFERWRAASPLNRQMYDEMNSISQGTRRLGASSVAEEHRALGARRPVASRPGLMLTAACAAATLIAGSAAVILKQHDDPTPEIAAAQPMSTAVGHIEARSLADGTRVILDADSEISVVFDQGRRLVRLVRGRARFDVAPDAVRPFMVEAGTRVILDKGTVFDVAIGRDGVEVHLLRGAVEIHERGTGSKPVGAVVAALRPGQAFADHQGPAGARVSPVVADAVRWPSGVLNYDGATLGDVIADLNRYSTHKLKLADPTLASLRVTGVFKASPIEGVAAALAASLNLRVIAASDGSLILQR